jgi:hypothetical protein
MERLTIYRNAASFEIQSNSEFMANPKWSTMVLFSYHSPNVHPILHIPNGESNPSSSQWQFHCHWSCRSCCYSPCNQMQKKLQL